MVVWSWCGSWTNVWASRNLLNGIWPRKIWERGAALTSRLQSFETALLTQPDNLAGLAALNRELVARAEAIDSAHRAGYGQY
jgi:hypothetical protein